MNPLHRAGIVFHKEVIDNLRDRRTLIMAMLFPLLGPLAVGLIAMVSASKVDQPLTLAVVGAQHAPNLIAFLRESEVKLVETAEDPERLVRDNRYDVVLVLSEAHGEALRAGKPAPVKLVLDESRFMSQTSIHRTRQLLGAYSGRLGALRLMVRGIDPGLVQGVALENADLSTPQSRSMIVLSMVPYFIIVAVFVGGLYIAIDTTAGEKERMSLEPLVINPVARWELVIGKLGATVVFAALALFEVMLGFGLLPHVLPLKSLGVSMRLDPGALLSIFLLVLPLLVLVSAFQMIVASYSRGFKDAQSTLSVLMILPAIPGMALLFAPVKATVWMMAIPTLAEQVLMTQLLRGDAIQASHVAVLIASEWIYALIAIAIAVKLYSGERLLFGK